MAQETVTAPQAADLHNGSSDNGASKPAVSFFSVKPQLLVPAPKADEAVQFYKSAFGAEEVKRENHPKRKAEQELPLVLAAELKFGSSVVIVSDDESGAAAKSEGVGYALCLETNDVGKAVDAAVKAGAVVVDEIVEGEKVCCGDRAGRVKDPYGYVWVICSGKKEDEAKAVAEA